MKQLLVLIFSLQSVILFAQKQQINCAENLQSSNTLGGFTYTTYPDSLVLTKYDNFEEVNNETPEELMRSILSASSLDWKNYNSDKQLTNSSQDFEKIENAADSNYYFILESKLEFSGNGNQYAIVKYRLYEEGNLYGFAEGMIRKEGRWYTTSEAELNQIVFFMGMIDLDFIEAIFRKNDTDNVQFNQVRNDYLNSGTINLTGLLASLEQSLSENEMLDILDPNRIFK